MNGIFFCSPDEPPKTTTPKSSPNLICKDTEQKISFQQMMKEIKIEDKASGVDVVNIKIIDEKIICDICHEVALKIFAEVERPDERLRICCESCFSQYKQNPKGWPNIHFGD